MEVLEHVLEDGDDFDRRTASANKHIFSVSNFSIAQEECNSPGAIGKNFEESSAGENNENFLI